ncbi:CPBP family glutamic-type intramembrane protease [Sedimentitalea sp. XS_ASV28]|uniref:type II CAAX prenyl endopeptidase Rce1 family protein n=1 Tax=Sedimentitalea sp. XS_ASV28 TaxID=3241296 RepID=UPI00351719D7
MQVAYAIMFFILVGVSETLRHGVFGLNPADTTTIIYGALAICALLLLKSDLITTIHRPVEPLYGSDRLNWSWRRSMLGVFLMPLLWIVPVAYGFALVQLDIHPIASTTVLETLLTQVLLVAVAEGLFFREAVVKVFGREILPVYLISTLALFIFYLPSGLPMAMIATGSGIYYLTLRLIGTNIWVVAALHGVTLILFGKVLSLGLSQEQFWPYSIYFMIASAALSLLVFMLFAPSPREARYA